MPLRDSIPVWPGDEPYRYFTRWRIADGESVNVGCISLSVHAGSHADAPRHFRDTGVAVEEMDLGAFIGPAMVIDVAGRDTIGIEDVAVSGLALAPRLLLRTGAWIDLDTFPTRFPVIASDVPEFLKSQGVVLLGIDLPSVDLYDSTDMPNHHALDACGVHILESLLLTDVPAGSYELIALPLKLIGADGAPVRAILRSATG